MKRNTKDLFFQTSKDIKSISILLALLGAILGKWTIWQHIFSPENDVDYRELLSVMIGVLTTIVVTTYSLTIVALQLASVQFSPRILRWFFAEDRFNQVVLGTFIGEITYLMLLKTWAPKTLDLPILCGLVIAILLICVLFPLFIAHIVDSINAGSILRRIAFHLIDEIDIHYGKDKIDVQKCLPAVYKKLDKQKSILLNSRYSGYVERVDYQLFEKIFQYVKDAAIAKNIVISEMQQTVSVGEFVAEGIPIFIFETPNAINELKAFETHIEADKNLSVLLQKAVKIEKYRSYRQDINFGIRQMVDIAIKAISPAVNDPTTCINSLDYLGMVLRRLVQCPPRCLAHETLPSYIHVKEFGFREYVDHAFDQIYHFGKTDFVVVSRILRTLRSVIGVAEYQPYIQILAAEYQDIKADILKIEDSFTKEGFKKLKGEMEACEEVFSSKIIVK